MSEILLTSEEVKSRLKLSENALRWLVRTRQIPFVRIGKRRIFFQPKELEDWINKGKVGVWDKLDNSAQRRL